MAIRLGDQVFKYASNGEVLIDLGCAYGACYSEVPSCLRYIGVDCSEKLVEIGRILHPDADFRVGDICHLDSIVSERANYFIASMVLGHIARPNVPKAFAALASRLHEGARGILTTYFTDRSYFLTCQEIGLDGDGGLIQGGFDEESLEPFLLAAGLKMGMWHYDYNQGIAHIEVYK